MESEKEKNLYPENVEGVQQHDVDIVGGVQDHQVYNELGHANNDYLDISGFNEKLVHGSINLQIELILQWLVNITSR